MKEEKNFKSTSNYQLEFFKYTLEKALKKKYTFQKLPERKDSYVPKYDHFIGSRILVRKKERLENIDITPSKSWSNATLVQPPSKSVRVP